jgi:hypothetical protein
VSGMKSLVLAVVYLIINTSRLQDSETNVNTNHTNMSPVMDLFRTVELRRQCHCSAETFDYII